MTETSFHSLVVWLLIALAFATVAVLAFRAAPYGRHSERGWGPTLPARLGWFVMELPAVAVMAVCFLVGDRGDGATALVFLAMWELHYVQRAVAFPLLMPEGARRIPLAIVAMGVAFNLANGYANGRWLFALGPDLSAEWLLGPRFVAGAALFLVGMAMNIWSDAALRRLRKAGGYGIPRGGLFEYVSCPNYLGEILEWCGWALATWSLPGLAFALWTAANLGPRAISHHRWYRSKMPDYPPKRKALVPFIL